VNAVVIDASALVAWLVGDDPPTAARVEAAIARREQAPLVAPALLRGEFADALSVAVRRSRLTPAQAQQAAAFADALPLELDPQAASVGTLLLAASAHGLTAYDAIYLRLAVLRGAALPTADRALAQAARKAGVTVQAH